MNLNEYPLWTAVITPMLENGTVDYASLEKVLRQQVEAKKGLLLLGSTGESLNLDLEEKKSILDFALGLKLPAPIMVGVGGINLKNTLLWVKHLEGLEVQAYLMVTPLYAKPGAQGQYLWFKELMDAASRAVMLYNIPGRTGTSLSREALIRLKEHPRFWAIKEASGSADEFAAYAKAAPNAVMMSGDDPMLPAYIPHGCQGLVSVASNAWPKKTHEYASRALKGELSPEDARLWKDSSQALFIAGNPVTVKRLMAEEGTIQSAVCRAPLTHLELEDPTPILKASRAIREWK